MKTTLSKTLCASAFAVSLCASLTLPTVAQNTSTTRTKTATAAWTTQPRGVDKPAGEASATSTESPKPGNTLAKAGNIKGPEKKPHTLATTARTRPLATAQNKTTTTVTANPLTTSQKTTTTTTTTTTPAATTTQATNSVNTSQNVETVTKKRHNNWGIFGLLGLLGLFNLSRRNTSTTYSS